jgi:hypothetical protein
LGILIAFLNSKYFMPMFKIESKYSKLKGRVVVKGDVDKIGMCILEGCKT